MMGTGKGPLAPFGIHIPELYLPCEDRDYTRYAVVACDQFSAQPDYWERVQKTVGDAPSALNLILPEAWLNTAKGHKEAIVPTMERYLAQGILRNVGEGMVLVHRQCSSGLRRGLVVAFDLEEYDYRRDSHALLRPTEATVEERLPPRIEIRRNAPLELPHVMVLYNDPADALMEALEKRIAACPVLYDFPLMEEGGQLKGYLLRQEEDYLCLAGELERLLKASVDDMLFAMGDGNHSFAAAKLYWEECKARLPEEAWEGHPARYALCELVNLYDRGLEFEPIHRLVQNIDPHKLCLDLELDPQAPPPLQELQPKLDAYLALHPQAKLEYIHGAETCRTLGKEENALALVWEEFPKETLFSHVAQFGPLCRKSFSMGQGRDKRYYLEARRIK